MKAPSNSLQVVIVCLFVILMASNVNTWNTEYLIFKYPDKIYLEDRDLVS